MFNEHGFRTVAAASGPTNTCSGSKQAMMAKTRGEEVFEDYLGGLNFTFDYEPPLGERHPDYLVHTRAGDVLCEVKDFEANEADRAEVAAALAGRDTGGMRAMPYARIQGPMVKT